MSRLRTAGSLTVILSALFGLAIGTNAAIAAEDRIQGPVESARSIPLAGSVNSKTRIAIDRGNDRGAVDPGMQINGVTLALAPSDAQRDALERFLEQERDPSSPDYRSWLTPEQYGERFGLSENDLARVSSWLQSEGFALEQVARGRNWITFNGTAAQLEKAFHGWARANMPARPGWTIPPATGTRIMLVDRPDLTQATIVLGHAGIKHADPRWYAVTLMNYVLGGSDFSSRLRTYATAA